MGIPKPCNVHVVGVPWQPGFNRVRATYHLTAEDVHLLRRVPVAQRLAFLAKVAGDLSEVRAFKLQSGRTRLRHAPDPEDAALLDQEATPAPSLPAGMTGHTPAPWHYDEKTGAIYVTPEGGGSASILQAFPNVRRKANGRLAAAAPDMLAALETIAQHGYGSQKTIAEAALAKARGMPA